MYLGLGLLDVVVARARAMLREEAGISKEAKRDQCGGVTLYEVGMK